MTLLAIESSCDEFSVSILKDGKILTNVISSQIKNHEEFGGVIPELAARLHVKNFSYVLKVALQEAKIDISEIEYVAYTHEPGLLPSLLVGRIVANTIGAYINKPVIKINHILGHIYGGNINNEFVYPVLALVVSGGHTHLQFLNSPHDYFIIGTTVDDAIGECYDKVARILGIPYPGGPELDLLASKNKQPLKYTLPSPKLNDEDFNFSFSGLKTASNNLINKFKQKNEKIDLINFAACFQDAAIKPLFYKLDKAIIEFKPRTVTIAGGVAANSKIRNDLKKLSEKYKDIVFLKPELEYCTDNAAMIAKYAEQYLLNK